MASGSNVSFGVDEKWTRSTHRSVFVWTAATVHIYGKYGSSPGSDRFNGSTTRGVVVDLHDIRTKDDAEADVPKAQAAPYATRISIYWTSFMLIICYSLIPFMLTLINRSMSEGGIQRELL
ncbi:hypothetical protein SBP18_17940 [Rhodoferax ferrireducens]|uniref:hypothetical protein n=1 Tax=Rhodoferax ferrireducens TaxID=192843 RepID=UPI00298E3FBC|nr:hypothetical protein [Rhodoferax ferrireducens]WPC66344.1 hypothetical protein SBP18_17940 [Rhodoferax ferrireducens]